MLFADQCQQWRWIIPQALESLSPEKRVIWLDEMQNMKNEIANSVIIVADNVYRYYTAQQDGGKDWRWKTDFPCVTPPFPQFFIEMNSSIPDAIHRFFSWGWLFQAVLRDSDDGRDFWRSLASCGAEIDPSAHWLMSSRLVISCKSGQIVGPFMVAFLECNDSGEIVGFPRTISPLVENVSDLEVDMSVHAMNPALLALSFMNCKNVEVVRHDPPTPTPRQQRHLKKPLLRYHTLNIEPMKRVLRTEGGATESSGLKRALHICRGHFANYTDKGLFGKYFGRFWVPAHVRGTIEEGIVAKDYAVKA